MLGSEKVEQDHESEEEHVEKEWNKVKLTKCSKRATTPKSEEKEKRVDE